jgi:hypothetical protein
MTNSHGSSSLREDTHRVTETAVVGDDELIADIDMAIADSLDQGWLTRDGARAIVSMFKAYGWSVVRGAQQ